MANCYSEGTGVLMAAKVTPVIEAFFGGMHLNPKYPGDGRFYIMTDGTVEMGNLCDDLERLCGSIGLSKVPENENENEDEIGLPRTRALLRQLATHFGCLQTRWFSEWIENLSDYESTDLDTVVEFVKCLDDGHGLTGMDVSVAQYADKARLDAFGGFATYTGQTIQASGGTWRLREFWRSCDRHLQADDLQQAVKCFHQQAWLDVGGVIDPRQRLEVLRHLAESLATRHKVMSSFKLTPAMIENVLEAYKLRILDERLIGQSMSDMAVQLLESGGIDEVEMSEVFFERGEQGVFDQIARHLVATAVLEKVES